MSVDISEYLDAIAGETEGEEVILAIHDAALALGTEMYQTASIAQLLEHIRTAERGQDIRNDIYEILSRLSEADPQCGGGVFGSPVVTDKGFGKFFTPEYTPFGIWQVHGDIMPCMDGITNYYDSKIGLTASSWQNRVTGGNNATLVNGTVLDDGALQVLCTESSYGYFDADIDHEGVGEMVIYIVFKAPLLGTININRHPVGSCKGSLTNYRQGAWFSASVDGYAGHDDITADLWGLGVGSSTNCSDYHVVTINKRYYPNESNKYSCSLYIDGTYIGATSSYNMATGLKFGIGVLRDEDGEVGFDSTDHPTQIKMIAVGGQIHSGGSISSNSLFLRRYYELS